MNLPANRDAQVEGALRVKITKQQAELVEARQRIARLEAALAAVLDQPNFVPCQRKDCQQEPCVIIREAHLALEDD